jgi:hypothetical protein
MPADAKPNLYLIGFLVEPAVHGPTGAVVVRNRIVSYITLDVPGPRHVDVRLAWHHVPRFAVGHALTGEFRVTSPAGSNVRFRGQVRVDSALRHHNLGVVPATGTEPLLLAGGAGRTVSYHWKVSGFGLLARPEVEVSYPQGTATMGTVTATGPVVLVVTPGALVATGVLLVAGALGLAWRRRSRRPARLSPRPRPAPSPSP